MSRSQILVVDDEPTILTTLRRALELEDYRVVTSNLAKEALARIKEEGADLALLDVAMPELDGISLLKQIRKDYPDLPVVMMSGESNLETAVRATKLGAHDFIEKPLSTDKLLLTIENALSWARLRRENLELRQKAGLEQMIGKSAPMQRIWQIIGKSGPTNGRVLITGANGTGKELVARAIHAQSKRNKRPFVKVNCAAIPTDLIESELFGHEKGSFTGATSLRRGKFEQAHSGTLFLDEIGDMSLSAQAKVLRVLQEGELERVGGSETLTVDVRVIAATNKDLQNEIAEGRFREDLFYRLNVVPIEVPPLKQRREDIAELVQYFLRLAAGLHDKPVKRIEQSALTLLEQHHWPGNVRELKNSVERMVILSDHDTISANDVLDSLPGKQRPAYAYRSGFSLKEMVADAEREIIRRTLTEHDGQVAKAAEALKLERSHLYKKMRMLGLGKMAG